jgi:putative ABC transport system permease protein
MAEWFEALKQDVHYALRGLRRTPVFTVVATLTLAIGIGANTTIFNAINAVLLRPLPYPEHDRLVRVSIYDPKYPRYDTPVSWTDVAHWKAASDAFEQIEGVSGPDMVAMSGGGSGERVAVQHFNSLLPAMLGVRPFLGSLPTDEKTEVLGFGISYEFWQRHFAGNPHVLGRTIFVDTGSGPIMVVLAPRFDLLETGPPDIFMFHGSGNPGESGIGDPRWVFAIGKLKHGISIQQAQVSMEVMQQHLAQAFPEAYKGMGVRVEPLRQGLFGWSSSLLSLLLAAVGFVLLIACANVANLLLVRADSRRKEIGVRVALGASRTRLIRQLLTESIVLSLVGGLGGLLLSIWGIKLFDRLSPSWVPRTANAPMDARILLFTFGICILTGIVFGVAPALHASKNDVNETLRGEGRTTAAISRHRTRNFLVIAEVAIALVLLIGAGLMINTLTHILRTNPGFNPDHLVTAQVRLAGDKYVDSTNPDLGLNVIQPAVALFCQQVLERLQSLPGVEAAAFVDWLPLSQDTQHAHPGFRNAGQAPPPSAEGSALLFDSVSPSYFRVMGIPILRGRGIDERDTESAPWVVVINETMARQFWPNEDPLGQVITFDSSPDERPRQIVGIAKNVKDFELARDAMPQAFVAYTQLPARTVPGWTEARVHKSLVIRTHFVSKELLEKIRKTISELAPDSAVFGITTVQQTVSDSARPWSFISQLLGLFAGVALLLAAIGIYGVISYSVSERSHELGLRMALGAQPSQVLGLVLRQAMRLSLLGVAIGVAASFLATPLLATYLYGVKPHDVLTLTLVSLLLIAVTLFASYVPARRAASIDPMETLRHD